MKTINKEQLNNSLKIKDLTSDNSHIIGIITNNIIKSLNNKYEITSNIIKESPIVNVKANYDDLYYPNETITKSSRYTRWINENELLRTHMTSCIPKQLRKIEEEEDTLLICPGLVYRRDAVDKTHVGEPHQMDIWKITKNKQYDRQDLLDLVQSVLDSILVDVKWRYNETSHYYTKDGIEIEVYINGEWLEILECGLALPKLLDDSGLDSKVWSGLALGIGLDRAAMITKNIKDIRVLRSDNPIIKKQMMNTEEYKDVSTQPSIKRDMSIAIGAEYDVDLIGDIIRELIGEDSNIIEEVCIKQEWNYSELPVHVSERLGMTKDMKNVLLSVIIRPLDKSMSRKEANSIYDILYNNLHKGEKGYYN